LKTKIKRLEKEVENKDNKIIGKIKRLEAKIHQSYQQEPDNNTEIKPSPIAQVRERQYIHVVRLTTITDTFRRRTST
jgi:hypothetical protein